MGTKALASWIKDNIYFKGRFYWGWRITGVWVGSEFCRDDGWKMLSLPLAALLSGLAKLPRFALPTPYKKSCREIRTSSSIACASPFWEPLNILTWSSLPMIWMGIQSYGWQNFPSGIQKIIVIVSLLTTDTFLDGVNLTPSGGLLNLSRENQNCYSAN